MKLCLIADTHFGVHKGHPAFSKNIKLFLENTFFPYIKENNIKHIIHLGDLVDSRRGISFQTINFIRNNFVNPIIKNSLHLKILAGNHDCLVQDAECLTKRGWCTYNELLKDDFVFSYVDGKGVWNKINDIIIKNYDGEIIKIKNRHIEMAVTPSHRVLLKEIFSNKIKYNQANHISKKGSFQLIMNSFVENKGIDLSDDEIKLVGWIITDGWIGKNKLGYWNIGISQSKIENVISIENILNKLDISYNKILRNRDIKEICGKKLLKLPLPQYEFHIHSSGVKRIIKLVDNKKNLPKWCMDLNNEQFHVLLDVLVAADGNWDGSKETIKEKLCCVLHKSKQFLESVQSIAVQHGWRSKIIQNNRGHFVLNMYKKSFAYVEKESIFKENYKGKVWCLNVPYGNFMIRYKGSAYFTGNCPLKNSLEYNAVRELLNEYNNIHVYDTPRKASIENFSFLMIPWLCDSNINEYNELVKDTYIKVIFGHFELNGYEMNNKMRCENGIEDVRLQDFDLTISGHFHNPSAKGTVHYLGAPCQFTWADNKMPRGFGVLDTETLKIDFVPNPYEMFCSIKYNENNISDNFLNYQDKMVKLFIENRTDQSLFEQYVKSIEEAGALSVKIIENDVDPTIDDIDIEDSYNDNPSNLFKDYLKSMVQTDEINKTKLEKILIQSYNEAQTIE